MCWGVFKASPFQSQSGPTGFSELHTISEATKIAKTCRRCCVFHKGNRTLCELCKC